MGRVAREEGNERVQILVVDAGFVAEKMLFE